MLNDHHLSSDQKDRHREFLEFAAGQVRAEAETWDREQRISESAIRWLGEAGYLGILLPKSLGGQGLDTVTFGLLNEALGRESPAYTGVVTVQSMVTMALLKWGSDDQRRQWLPPLARGELVGAFALTEPGAGSDLSGLTLEFARDPESDGWIVSGEKQWISCAQFAGVFLVFGQAENRPIAGLIPGNTEGLVVEPIHDLMGFRAAGLGRLRLDGVRVAAGDILGKPGYALSHVAQVGLHYGRISTACSCLGLLRGCLEESAGHAARRRVSGQPIGELGMIRSLIARMGVDLEAAALLCLRACRAADERLPEAFERALMAKYFVSRAAVRAASDAVQIRGASGCHASSPVSRYYRDSKILEIIEGTTQVHEQLLGKMFVDQSAGQ